MDSPRIDRIGSYAYTFHQPPPLPAQRRCTVAVVGGGPVGLACALGLARQGIASVVIEADDSVCIGSRAACISRRSLEIVGRLGGLQAMLARGLPWSGGRSFWGTREVFRFTMPEYPGQRLPPMINLQQYYIEDALLAAVHDINAERPGTIDVLWATTVEAMETSAMGVSLGLVNDAPAGASACAGSPRRGSLHADWVLACDGGQSFVRSALGLSLQGAAYTGRYAIVDILLPSGHATERRAWFDPPWYRGGTILMHRQPDDLWRIDWQLRPGQSSEEALQPDKVRAFVQSHLDAIGEGQLPWQPVWSSIYRAGAMTLGSYRHGRILFAGNAAHAMPIFGVRGLNSGLDDADNLAWKLAAVIRGEGADALLDSYSRERIAAFHINADSARRSTEFMSPPSRGFELLREAVLSLAAGERGIAELVNPRQTAAVAYGGSELSEPDATHDTWVDGPAPGEVLTEWPVGGPTAHLTECVGPGFVLLHFGLPGTGLALPAGVVLVPVLAAPDGRWPGSVIDEQGRVARAFDAADGTGYLVRPDGHVAARWKVCTPAAVADAHRRALGHGAAPERPLDTPSAATARDRLYHRLAQGITAAGAAREPLLLARLALLLFERLGDEAGAAAAIDAALHELPQPSLSAASAQPAVHEPQETTS
jgi:3-(3-hydroxy-phenyl)propionate hydroxylase